ncbi:hypothetical protein AB0D47_02565 [Streptomyces sp. NPDC048376]|uniref:hypothetical protein n=1 Tax=Streptomyces sp. NPDC048376 TaxID=3154926 RepID=UPI003426C983
MSDALEKAEQAAREAASNTDVLAVAMAALDLAKSAQAQTQQQPAGCGHDHSRFDARKWWTIGGLVIVGGCVACALALAFAVAMVAVAIGATSATGSFLILRSIWIQTKKGP